MLKLNVCSEFLCSIRYCCAVKWLNERCFLLSLISSVKKKPNQIAISFFILHLSGHFLPCLRLRFMNVQLELLSHHLVAVL